MFILRIAVMVACVATLSAATARDYSHEGLFLSRLSAVRDDHRTMVCTQQYAPVCGRLNGLTTTYPNRCFARLAGAEVIADGPCGPVVDRPHHL
jgi:hypothetical protein